MITHKEILLPKKGLNYITALKPQKVDTEVAQQQLSGIHLVQST